MVHGVMGSRRAPRRLLAAVAGVLIGMAALNAAPVSALPAQAAACNQDVAFGLVEATSSGCLNQVVSGQWQTTDTISLIGVAITAVSGKTVVLVGADISFAAGPISV